MTLRESENKDFNNAWTMIRRPDSGHALSPVTTMKIYLNIFSNRFKSMRWANNVLHFYASLKIIIVVNCTARFFTEPNNDHSN